MVQYAGPWYSTGPAPEPNCKRCGAVRDNDQPVIQMRRSSRRSGTWFRAAVVRSVLARFSIMEERRRAKGGEG